MEHFELVSPYQPTGDQPQAIDKLVAGLRAGYSGQTLLGVTGSGKTFTMANVIARVNRPTLVLAHNKTLAAQLCTEFKEFFPNNAVEYFVSYYDYYQPEAYIPSTDTYIEKDSAINDEIDRLRHSATAALSERRDVIIVASVSCIYSLGDPIDYRSMVISIREGMQMEREELMRRLVTLQYERNDVNFVRNKFRVRGDVVEINLAYASETAIRVEFFGDEVDTIRTFDVQDQLSKEHKERVQIVPKLSEMKEDRVPFLQLLPPTALLVMQDFTYVHDTIERIYNEGFAKQVMQEQLEGATELLGKRSNSSLVGVNFCKT